MNIMNDKPTYEMLEKRIAQLEQEALQYKEMKHRLEDNEYILNETGILAKIGGWEHDLVTGKAKWTKPLYDIIEIDESVEPPGVSTHLDYYPPAERKKLENAYNKAVNEGVPFDLEMEVFTAKGRRFWCRAKGKPLFQNGRCIKLLGTFQDITEQKEYKRSLKGIEWLLRIPDLRKKKHEQPYGDLSLLNEERLILDSVGKPMLSEIVRDFMDLLETSAAVYEKKGAYAHGIFSSGWCRLLDNASRDLCKTVSNKKAIDSGRWHCHESCWKKASEVSIKTGIPVDVECNGGLRLYSVPIFANEKAVGAINLGYGDPPKHLETLNKIAALYDIPMETLLDEALKYESRPRFIIEAAKSRLNTSAKLIGALIERKLAEKSLEEEREKLKVTLKSIGDGVITTDCEGRIMMMNKVAELMTGWSFKEAYQQQLDKVFVIVNELTGAPMEDPVKRVLITQKRIELENNTMLISKDNDRRIISDSGAPIIDDRGKTIGVVLVFSDVTRKKEMEKELLNARKMEAISTLTGGIAHEFNNVLGIMIGNAEMCLDEVQKKSSAYEFLREVLTAGFRAKDVVKQLLSFSYNVENQKEPLNLVDIVRSIIKLLRASSSTDIDFVENIVGAPRRIMADQGQMRQILINLAANATYAMSDKGGSLTIGLKDINYEARQSNAAGVAPLGPQVRITVEDTGQGISPEHMDKIFDPYFTTKEDAMGAGMGLSVVHGIVTNHGGVIRVKSIKGKGTVIEVDLPALSEETAAVEPEELPVGTERILFVDDEPSIVKMGDIMLKRLGYTAKAFTNPEEALEKFKNAPDDFDLLVTDIAMPGMTGINLAREIINIKNDIPVIICTGYSEKIDQEHALELGIKNFIIKPFNLSQFAKLIRKVLDDARVNWK